MKTAIIIISLLMISCATVPPFDPQHMTPAQRQGAIYGFADSLSTAMGVIAGMMPLTEMHVAYIMQMTIKFQDFDFKPEEVQEAMTRLNELREPFEIPVDRSGGV